MNKLISEASAISVSELDNNSSVQTNNTTATQQSTLSSSNVNNMLEKILPLVISMGGISMLFGKGLFGIGSGRSGLLGGFWGKLLGGSILATVLPSLWSNQNFSDRLKTAAKKLTNGDFIGFLKTFFGLDAGADKAIKSTQQKVTKLALNKDTIEAKAKQFTSYAVPFTKILDWMKKSEHAENDASLIYLTPTVALTIGKTTTSTEKILNNEKDKFIAILFLNDAKQIQIQMAQVQNLTGTLDTKFIKILKEAMQANELHSGIEYIDILKNPSTDLQTWFITCKKLVNGLNTIRTDNKGYEIILKIFNNGMTNLCEGHSLKVLDLPPVIEQSIKISIKKFKLICQDAQQSLSNLLNDPELAALKEDPTLNKFDEDIKLLDEQITDNYIKLIQMLLVNQDENGKPIYQNVDACVIYGQLQKQHYYYCRDRQNGYLTTDVSKSVIFPVSDIKKIENESPIEVSTGQHMSFETAVPVLWEQYSKNQNKELKAAFDTYKEAHKENTNIKELFKQFVKQHGENILPYKKEKRDIVGSSIGETLKKFLIAVKLPQIMKLKKPGIKINVYETNLAFIEKLKSGLKEKLHIDITQG